MSSRRRRAAIAIIRRGAAWLPDERKIWADAMRAEIDHIEDDGAALGFAIGCLRVAAKAHLSRTGFVAQMLRFGIAAGLSLLALLAAILSGRHFDLDTEVAVVFGVSSIIFGAGAWTFATKGVVALGRLALILGLLYLVVLALIVVPDFRASGIADSPLYRTLAMEGVAIWFSLFLLANFMDRSRRMPGSHNGSNGS